MSDSKQKKVYSGMKISKLGNLDELTQQGSERGGGGGGGSRPPR